MAAQRFAGIFANDVTINFDVSFATLPSGTLGSANTTRQQHSYASVRDALLQRVSSANDLSAAPYLTPRLSFLSNEAGNCATGVGCEGLSLSSRTLDDDATFDNLNLAMSSGNAKALGLLEPHFFGRDAGLAFSSRIAWDFDPTDGITTGTFDFVGVATHEIAHALGFLSGVDLADGMMAYAYQGMDMIAWGTVLDLFRYTGLERDWTVGGLPCTSANGGRTCIGTMSTGTKFGNRYQAGHWRSATTGLMAPTVSAGRLMRLTANDIAALDLVGWTLLAPFEQVETLAWTIGDPLNGTEPGGSAYDLVATPSAPAIGLFGLGVLGLAARRRRRG